MTEAGKITRARHLARLTLLGALDNDRPQEGDLEHLVFEVISQTLRAAVQQKITPEWLALTIERRCLAYWHEELPG